MNAPSPIPTPARNPHQSLLDWLFSLGKRRGGDRMVMPRGDHDRYTARTLRDLADLTAQWLEGRVVPQPDYEPNRGPDEDTALAALNRAGCLTYSSQLGEEGPGWDGAFRRQRAAVSGWVDPELRDRLVHAAHRASLIVITHPPAGRWSWGRRRATAPGVVVTISDGRPRTRFGWPFSRRGVLLAFDECHPAAVAAVLAAEQITVVDPVWGRNDVLWRLLKHVAAHSPITDDGGAGRR